MTIGNIIRAALETAQIQFIDECLVNISAHAAKKATRRNDFRAQPAHTRITFATTNVEPGHFVSRHNPAPYVGVVVWIPRDEYDRLSVIEDDDPDQKNGESQL